MHPAAEFVIAMFGPHPEGRIYIAALPNPEVKTTESEESHVLSRSSVQITDFVTRHDQPGEGCFTCVATIQNKATRRAEKTVAQIVCLHTEIDFRQIQETPEAAERVVAGLSPPPSRAHHSGHGLHLYWFLKISIAATPEANARHKQLLRRVANHLGGDQAACLVHQLLRLPGTTNSKKGEQLPVRTLIDRPDRRYDYAELESWIATAGAPLLHRKAVAATAGNGESPDNPFLAFAARYAGAKPLDVDRMFAEMVYLGPGGGGNAHDTLLRCTAAMLTRGEASRPRSRADWRNCRLPPRAPACALDPARERRNIEEMCRSWNEKHPESNQGDEEFEWRPHSNHAVGGTETSTSSSAASTSSRS